jgi:hypothetical protein
MGPVTAIERLTGVYHADGGLAGELRYGLGKLLGRAHCSLCDLTHRVVGGREEWRELVRRLGVPVTLVHLNERDPDIARLSDGTTPCVVAHTDGGVQLLLGPADIDACGGDLSAFEQRLRQAAGRAGLSLGCTRQDPGRDPG